LNTKAELHKERGDAFFDSEGYGLALVEYTQAIELDPTCAPAYIKRGLVYHQLNKYGLALMNYSYQHLQNLYGRFALSFCLSGE